MCKCFHAFLLSHLLLLSGPRQQAHEQDQSPEVEKWPSLLNGRTGRVTLQKDIGMGRFIVALIASNLPHSPVFPIFCVFQERFKAFSR